MDKAISRLRTRENSFLSKSYLAYRALWPALISAIETANGMVSLQSDSIVLDIGCGEKPYADCFPDCRYIGLNYSSDGASPDVIGNAQQLPFKTECADIVFSTQVIEHLSQPGLLLSEAHRVLRSKGIFVISGPFYWPLHEEPFDYFRFTKHGFKSLLEDAGFSIISITPDSKSLTQAAVSLIEALPRSFKFLIPLINIATPPLQRLSDDERCTLNYVCIAQKP